MFQIGQQVWWLQQSTTLKFKRCTEPWTDTDNSWYVAEKTGSNTRKGWTVSIALSASTLCNNTCMTRKAPFECVWWSQIGLTCLYTLAKHTRRSLFTQIDRKAQFTSLQKGSIGGRSSQRSPGPFPQVWRTTLLPVKWILQFYIFCCCFVCVCACVRSCVCVCVYCYQNYHGFSVYITHTHKRAYARAHTHSHTRTISNIYMEKETGGEGKMQLWLFCTCSETDLKRPKHQQIESFLSSWVCVRACVCVCVTVYVGEQHIII